jgi:hypothetical protein
VNGAWAQTIFLYDVFLSESMPTTPMQHPICTCVCSSQLVIVVKHFWYSLYILYFPNGIATYICKIVACIADVA